MLGKLERRDSYTYSVIQLPYSKVFFKICIYLLNYNETSRWYKFEIYWSVFARTGIAVCKVE